MVYVPFMWLVARLKNHTFVGRVCRDRTQQSLECMHYTTMTRWLVEEVSLAHHQSFILCILDPPAARVVMPKKQFIEAYFHAHQVHGRPIHPSLGINSGRWLVTTYRWRQWCLPENILQLCTRCRWILESRSCAWKFLCYALAWTNYCSYTTLYAIASTAGVEEAKHKWYSLFNTLTTSHPSGLSRAGDIRWSVN